MCDWTTHLAIGWLITKTGKIPRTSFLIGCVLPDLIWIWSYVLSLFLDSKVVDALLRPSHTILGALLLSIAASMAFRNDVSRTFGSLFSGSLSHLFLDLLMKASPGYGIFLLWPFSWMGYALNVISIFDPTPAIVSSALCITVLLIERSSLLEREFGHTDLSSKLKT